jgi:hypothetical protein
LIDYPALLAKTGDIGKSHRSADSLIRFLLRCSAA